MVTEKELVSCRVTLTPMGKNRLWIGRVTYLARAQLLTRMYICTQNKKKIYHEQYLRVNRCVLKRCNNNAYLLLL